MQRKREGGEEDGRVDNPSGGREKMMGGGREVLCTLSCFQKWSNFQSISSYQFRATVSIRNGILHCSC